MAQDQIMKDAPGGWECDVDLTDMDIHEFGWGSQNCSVSGYESNTKNSVLLENSRSE